MSTSKSAPPMTVNDERHGTTTGYKAGCRDRCCRAAATAQRRYHRALARKRGLAPDDPRHGTLNGQTNWGCRCEPCRNAGRTAKTTWQASQDGSAA